MKCLSSKLVFCIYGFLEDFFVVVKKENLVPPNPKDKKNNVKDIEKNRENKENLEPPNPNKRKAAKKNIKKS